MWKRSHLPQSSGALLFFLCGGGPKTGWKPSCKPLAASNKNTPHKTHFRVNCWNILYVIWFVQVTSNAFWGFRSSKPSHWQLPKLIKIHTLGSGREKAGWDASQGHKISIKRWKLCQSLSSKWKIPSPVLQRGILHGLVAPFANIITGTMKQEVKFAQQSNWLSMVANR